MTALTNDPPRTLLDRTLRMKGLKLKPVAKAIGTYPVKLGRWVKAESLPDIVEAWRLSRVLGIPLEDLAKDFEACMERDANPLSA